MATGPGTLVVGTVASISVPLMARPGVVGACATAAAAQGSAAPMSVTPVAIDFMIFTSCFAAEINTASSASTSGKDQAADASRCVQPAALPLSAGDALRWRADGNLADASNYACMAPK